MLYRQTATAAPSSRARSSLRLKPKQLMPLWRVGKQGVCPTTAVHITTSYTLQGERIAAQLIKI